MIFFLKSMHLERIQKEYDKLGCKWAFSGFSNWDGKEHMIKNPRVGR